MSAIEDLAKNAVQFVPSLIDTAVNYNIAKKNLGFQQQQFEYNKQLNDIQMEREDTAYQRAVKDAQSAGLSALSVSSGASSSAGTPLSSAPQNQYHSDLSNNVNNAMNTIANLQNLSIAKRKADAEINKINAETLLSTQALTFNNRTNPLTKQILEQQLEGYLADNIAKNNQNSLFNIQKDILGYQRDQSYFDTLDKKNIASYNRKFGLNSSMSEAERFSSFINGLNKNKSYDYYNNLGEFTPSSDDSAQSFVTSVLLNNPISILGAISGPLLKTLGVDIDDVLSGSAEKLRNSLKGKSYRNDKNPDNGIKGW